MTCLLKSCVRLDRALEIFLMILMILLVADVTWQVITRFILPKPSPFTEELARFLLIWISFLGSAFAYRKGMHLGIDFFVQKMAPASRKNIEYFILACCAAFAIIILIIGGTNRVIIAFELNQVAAALSIQMGYVFLVTPLTGVLFVIYTLEFLIKSNAANSALMSNNTETTS